MDIVEIKSGNLQEKQSLGFYDVLAETQQYISANYSDLLNEDNNSSALTTYVKKYVIDNNISVSGMSNLELSQRLISEMTGFSFLSAYFNRKDIEEININSWQDVKITYESGEILPSDEKFTSKDHAIDVMRRLLTASHIVWDKSQCIVVGHLDKNIRITVTGFDIVDDDVALSVSIRIVNPKKLKKEDFIEFGTATTEMLDFLSSAYIYGISMCITGATSSGKTTLMSWILEQIPYSKRLITIEQGCREFDCVKKDKDGNVLNNVCHFTTKSSDDIKQEITQIKLLETIMTMNPDYIAVSETKGEEGMQAIQAANTGHGVITTTHANSCEDTYYRMLALCKLKYLMDDTTILNLATRAFPIVVYCKQLEDKSRRIMEIAEREYQADGKHTMRTLYRFNATDTKKAEDGKTKIIGHYETVDVPSESLRRRLRENGMPLSLQQHLFMI